jgi:GNAT superfamily N-acetyltransferase
MAKALSDILVRPMAREDVAKVQEVGATAWSDLATKELGRKVSYPSRPRRIIEAYMWKEPKGCLVAEHDGKIIGVAYSHVWGEVGWLGPFEVLPDVQDRGVGSALLSECDAFLGKMGCKVLGLETMSNNTKNIHFYMRAGYRVVGSSLIMERKLTSEVEKAPGCEPSSVNEVISALGEISELSHKGHPMVDYAREVEMAARHELGPVFMWRERSRLKGMAVAHSYFPPGVSDHVSLRLLLIDPKSKGQERAFAHLLASCEAWAFEHGRRRLFIRFPAVKIGLYHELLASGYRLAAANLRLARGAEYNERGRYHLASWAG